MKERVGLVSKIPLTLMGGLVLLLSISSVSFALMSQNPAVLYLSSLGAILPLILMIWGNSLRSKVLRHRISMNCSPVLCAGRKDIFFQAVEEETLLLWFFRRHIILKGELDLQGTRAYRYYYDLPCQSNGGEQSILPPVSGLLKISAQMEIRDVLGLSRWILEGPRTWEIPVLPWGREKDYGLPAFESENKDDQRPVKKQEQEKIFTREYMAGDLARDINWKSSVRIGKLITRIPPESLGRSPQLPVYFRSPPADQGYHSLFYLEQQKALLVGFLRILMEQDRSFQIFLNREEIFVEDPDELSAFEKRLASLGFSTSYQDYPLPKGEMDCCLFSSCLDRQLLKDLKSIDKAKVHLFVSQPMTVERPGDQYQLFQQWPEFLPGRTFLRSGDPKEIGLPRHLGEIQQFSLEGRW